MVIRQFLALAAISLTLGACSFPGSSANLPAQNSSQPNEQPAAVQRPDRKINLATVAQKLGVSEAKLKEALGVPVNPNDAPGKQPPRPDLKGSASKLGVSEEQLREALGIPTVPPSNLPSPASN